MFCLPTAKLACSTYCTESSFKYSFLKVRHRASQFFYLIQHFLSTDMDTLIERANICLSGAICLPVLTQPVKNTVVNKTGNPSPLFCPWYIPPLSFPTRLHLKERKEPQPYKPKKSGNTGLVAFVDFDKEYHRFIYKELGRGKCCILLYLNSC